MSLDVYIKTTTVQPKTGSGIFVRENGSTVEITEEEWNERNPGHTPCRADRINVSHYAYEANITHNMGKTASAVKLPYGDDHSLYKYLWRPEELSLSKAEHLIEPLTEGLRLLKAMKSELDTPEYNPENGWGNYDGLVQFTESYLAACKEFPDGVISVSR